MPDVKVYINEHRTGGHVLLEDELPEIVAEQMSCTVDGEFYKLDPSDEIDLFVIFYTHDFELGEEGVMLDSKTDILVEVAAYDFPDRMSNITERITNIADGVKKLFGVIDPSVSITFIPVRQGCWVKV